MARFAMRSAAVMACLLSMFLGRVQLVGAHGGDTSLIHGCVNNANGLVRIVGATNTCQSHETAVHWPATAPSAGGARFLALLASETVVALTNLNTQWDDIPGLSASFTTTAQGCIVATLTLENSLDTGRHPSARILLDNNVMEGQHTYFTMAEPAIALDRQTHYTVWECNVPAGSHLVKAQ
jgi:hypothetical protein